MNERIEDPKSLTEENQENVAAGAAENMRRCVFHAKSDTAVAGIDFDGLPECKIQKPQPVNVEKEARKIADAFNNGNDPEKVVAGVNRLSSDLQALAGNTDKYNQLIKAVVARESDEPVSNPVIGLMDFNEKTRTWNSLSVWTYHLDGEDNYHHDQGHLPAFRIVQPGNTLSGIAGEMSGQAPLQSPMTIAEYTRYLQKINNIENPNKIRVGQAIKLSDNIFTDR
jgi:nucleoid-associated protein YgaU